MDSEDTETKLPKGLDLSPVNSSGGQEHHISGKTEKVSVKSE